MSFSVLCQSLHSLCQPHPALRAWPMVTRLTCSAWWNLATALASLPPWPGAFSREKVAVSRETWWRSLVTVLCSGVSRHWASEHAPQWTARAPTPTSALVSPEPGAKRRGHTNASPCCTAETTTAPGRSLLTAHPTCWASVLCSQVCFFFMLLLLLGDYGGVMEHLWKWCYSFGTSGEKEKVCMHVC